MRTKLFIAFIIVILASLVSTVIFEALILRDFGNYVGSVKKDEVYWIIASVEGGYKDGRWDEKIVSESVHWAMMMGLDIKVLDMQGNELVHSHHVMESLAPGMKRRMQELFRLDMGAGSKYEEFPIVLDGVRVGTLKACSFKKKELAEKELVFEGRVKHFLYVYLIIAGAGCLLLGLMFTQYLSKPVMVLTKACEKIANGDFSVRIAPGSSDEVGNLTKTFNKVAASLEKEEALRKRLMSNIAHELRTPLTIMKTNVEAMTDGIVTDTAKGLENITVEIERLITLVKGIEDMTAAEAGFFARGEEVEIDPGAFISGIVSELRPLFQARGLFIEIADKGGLCVAADVEKLERILRNLLSNAMKYTETGGVTIDYGIADNRFYIEVSDTGKGISEIDLPHIFDRFYRSGDANSEGLGLGLAIVKELTDIMEGDVDVRSIHGKGSCFRISLPLRGK